MKITADTNVLLRLVLADHAVQSHAAVDAMERADLVAISVHSFCELAWVLSSRNATPREEIAAAIRGLMEAGNVVVNRPAIQAGLDCLERGGDFADGVIAFDGRCLGGETFVSFDRKAVKLLEGGGIAALLLS